MTAPVVRADYDRLPAAGRHFSGQPALIWQYLQDISRKTDLLQGGVPQGTLSQAEYITDM